MSDQPEFTRRYIDLAQPRLGADVISASDEFFADRHRLIDPKPPIFIDGKYDDHGKWMDGWETRRKRGSGHDHCIVRICPGRIVGVEIDTAFFTGNYPPEASLEACQVADGDPDQTTQWRPLVSRMRLNGDSKHHVTIADHNVWTHLRLNIFPDGGVARLRVFGEAHCDWSRVAEDEWIDLLAMCNGGRALACNDMHYGHMANLIAPGQGVSMADGWETRRRRESGYDWVVLKLGHPGLVRKVEVDTAFFKGNYPASCSLFGAVLESDSADQLSPDHPQWLELLPAAALGPDQVHLFESEVIDVGRISHVMMKIFPDGGVSRLRLYGPIVR